MNGAELQEAIFERLTSWAALDSILARRISPGGSVAAGPAVYDHVPHMVDDSGHYPYVVIGDDTASDFDTDTSVGSEATVTIHTWSRHRGRIETKNIQRAIYTALNRHDLAVAGRHTVDSVWEYAESILEEDGITRHGIMRFRITTEEQ